MAQQNNLYSMCTARLQQKLSLTLLFLQDRIYWTDRDRAAVFMANRLSGQDIQTLAENLNDPHDIVVFHQLRQPPGAPPPSVAAGLCSKSWRLGVASPPQLMNEPIARLPSHVCHTSSTSIARPINLASQMVEG